MEKKYRSGDTKKEKNKVKIVLAEEEDLELIMAWRSNKEIFRFFKKQKRPLVWKQHLKFWEQRRNRKDFIIKYLEDRKWRKVGAIYFTKLDSKLPEIGIFVGEVTLQGKGVGLIALQKGLDYLQKEGYKAVIATINVNNIASQGLFTKARFKLAAKGGSEWQQFVIDLRE